MTALAPGPSEHHHDLQVMAWLRCKVAQALSAFRTAAPSTVANLDHEQQVGALITTYRPSCTNSIAVVDGVSFTPAAAPCSS